MSLPARLRAFGISKALDYLERDPDANLPKLMDWLDKYTGERLASPYRELFHRAMSDPGNNWHRLIKSMYTDIDSRVLKKIFENFVIHAGLMDWPSRNAAGELGNGRAPWAVIIDPSFPCEMGCRGCGASIYGVRPYMEFDSLDEEIEARKGRGCHLFIFSGGNPLQQAHRLRVRRFHAAPVHHRRAVRRSVAGAQPVPRHSGGRGRRRRHTGHGPAAAVQAALRRGLPLHSGERRAGGHRTLL